MAYKVGQVYYRVIDGFDFPGDDNDGQRWRIVALRFTSETKNHVFADHIKSGKNIQFRKPWPVFVSPWDAVDEKIADLKREANSIRKEAQDEYKFAMKKAGHLEAQTVELAKFRATIEIVE